MMAEALELIAWLEVTYLKNTGNTPLPVGNSSLNVLCLPLCMCMCTQLCKELNIKE